MSKSLVDVVVFFDDLPPESRQIAGGKGSSLSRMAIAGLPVPPGFVVLADAFAGFLTACGGVTVIAALTKDLDIEDAAALDAASSRIRRLILETPMPQSLAGAIRNAHERLPHRDNVAVRSSAVAEDGNTASFAGQQESYLNVQSPEDVLDRVKHCWASFFLPRALFYRAQKGALADTRMAVVVQQMVLADTSGVLFTVDPIRGRRDRMVVEAARGLGEAIVSGEIIPDHYVVSRDEDDVVDTVLTDDAAGPVLRRGELMRLRDLGVRLERFFGSPQDVEWCIRGEELLLLQSRPITTLGAHG